MWSEKDRRIYYQGIVYDVCNKLDMVHQGRRPMVCGTVEAPTTDVQDTMSSLIQEVERLRLRLVVLQTVVVEQEVQADANDR